MKLVLRMIVVMMGILISGSGVAGEKSLHAHEHGAIKVGMAVEKNTVEIDIDGPAESFLGFEYAPKTAKEKKVFSDLETKWTKNLDSLISFDKKLNCQVTEANFTQVIEAKKADAKKETGVHSEIEATAKLVCAHDLNGSEVSVALRKSFKHIKKLSVEIIGNESKTIEITKAVQTFKI